MANKGMNPNTLQYLMGHANITMTLGYYAVSYTHLDVYKRQLELRKMPLLSLNDNEYYIVTNSKFAYEVEDNKDIELSLIHI